MCVCERTCSSFPQLFMCLAVKEKHLVPNLIWDVSSSPLAWLQLLVGTTEMSQIANVLIPMTRTSAGRDTQTDCACRHAAGPPNA